MASPTDSTSPNTLNGIYKWIIGVIVAILVTTGGTWASGVSDKVYRDGERISSMEADVKALRDSIARIDTTATRLENKVDTLLRRP